MDLGARAHTLDNFLPQIAALIRVNRVHGFGLLDEITLRYVLSIARNAVFKTHDIAVFGRGLRQSRIGETFKESCFFGWRYKDSEAVGLSAGHAGDKSAVISF